MNKNLLKAKIQEITMVGLPFMEGKEQLKVESIFGQVVTVDEYGFLTGEKGEYVVITLKEYPTFFMYGASVVTQNFRQLEEMLTKEEKAEVLKDGLTFIIEEKKSKNNFKYQKLTFFPEDEEINE